MAVLLARISTVVIYVITVVDYVTTVVGDVSAVVIYVIGLTQAPF